MVSTIKYPNFKKVGIPRSAVWVVPIVIIVAIVLGLFFKNDLSKILFIPLLLYALYGLKKNVDRRLKKRSRKRGKSGDQPEDPVQSEHTA
ncbi:hypothetical protein D3C78_874560 [compost metagenome]